MTELEALRTRVDQLETVQKIEDERTRWRSEVLIKLVAIEKAVGKHGATLATHGTDLQAIKRIVRGHHTSLRGDNGEGLEARVRKVEWLAKHGTRFFWANLSLAGSLLIVVAGAVICSVLGL